MSCTNNFKHDIEEALKSNGETTLDIEAVVIPSCKHPQWYNPTDPRDIPKEMEGRPLTWQAVWPFLNYIYDSGYGSQDCHDIRVYTKDYIYYIHEYDGSTRVQSIERNPS